MFFSSSDFLGRLMHDPLGDVRRDLRDPVAETRGRAMQRLLKLARDDARWWPHALPLFRESLSSETDPWTIATAASGIELVAGADEGRAAWRALLAHANPRIVAHAALSLERPEFVEDLIDVLARRDEPEVRACVVRTLGRSRVPRAFAPIVAMLPVRAVQNDAILALGELGDPRAIPHLRAFLDDHTPWAQQDERGAMLRVSDLAADAIRQIEARVRRVVS